MVYVLVAPAAACLDVFRHRHALDNSPAHALGLDAIFATADGLDRPFDSCREVMERCHDAFDAHLYKMIQCYGVIVAEPAPGFLKFYHRLLPYFFDDFEGSADFLLYESEIAVGDDILRGEFRTEAYASYAGFEPGFEAIPLGSYAA